MFGKVISFSQWFKTDEGKQFYKVFILLDDGSIGFVTRDSSHLPELNAQVEFVVSVGKDSKFIVNIREVI